MIYNEAMILKNRFNFSYVYCVTCTGRKGGLLMLWNSEVDLQLASFSRFHINMEVRNASNSNWWITGFYGDSRTSYRDDGWQMLRNIKGNIDGEWLIIGDYNGILCSNE